MVLGLESTKQVGGESWGKDGAWKKISLKTENDPSR